MQDRQSVSSRDPDGLPKLGWMPLPAMLVAADRRLRACNARVSTLNVTPITDSDIAFTIRDPGVLACLDRVMETGLEEECSLLIPGQAQRVFTVWVYRVDLERGHYMLTFYETTQAFEAERMRSTFVADVSHELRSPLTTMIATLETLKGNAGSDPAARARFLDLTTAEASRMHRIVDDLLALSATEARRHIPPVDKVALASMLQNIVATASEKLSLEDRTVQLDLAEGLPPVTGDSDALCQVFQNLFDNAVKYGAPGSEIIITLEKDTQRGQQIVRFLNHGDVIPAEHIPRLTERFYRIDSSRSRHLGGTGLGLAIVKHILGRHHGHLHIESSDEGGTIFSVFLPGEAWK